MSLNVPNPDTQIHTLGRYELIERIAQGGMAEVFKARLPTSAGMEKLICIKRILPALSQNQEFVRLFTREAQIALQLSHGNITQVFDFGQEQGTAYLAMEYVHGVNLAQILARLRERNVPLDVDAALYIVMETLKGLHFAHRFVDPAGLPLAIVHRDVSPQNILISYFGEVKVADFGIALAADRAGLVGQAVRGKPAYLSPEQLAGQPGDARSDLFSLGVVLYEMLTGTVPFAADRVGPVRASARSSAVVPPSQCNLQLDPELDALVLTAIQADPAKRFADAKTFQVAAAKALYQRAPDYTADRLRQAVEDLFSWELAVEAEGGKGPSDPRQRLLVQLSRGGVKVDASAPIDQLLKMATVTIPPDASAAARPGRRSKRLWGAAAGVCAIIAAWFFVSTWGSVESPSSPPLAPPPIPQPTEHLQQRSVRTVASGQAAAPDADDASLAYLNANSWPWSEVYLNGEKLAGNTPYYRLPVSAGEQRLRFYNPDLRLEREVTVAIAAGQTQTVAVILRAP